MSLITRLFSSFKGESRVIPEIGERDQTVPADGDGLVSISLRSLIGLNGLAQQLATQKPKRLSQRTGQYISSFKGRGMEFSEARPYIPGDDIRTIDWRVTARTGKTHTKLFREERELAIHIAVDLNRSMHFATRGAFKSVIASQMAAILAWQAQKRGDRLGGMVFSEVEHLESRPQTGRHAVLHLFNQLVSHSAWQQSSQSNHQNGDNASYQHMLQRLQRVTHPGAHITIISDFQGFGESEEQIIGLLSRHCEIQLIMIHDPFERSLPEDEQITVSHIDDVVHIDTSMRRVLEAYQQRFAQRYEALREWCKRYRIQLVSCSTDDDPAMVLQEASLKRVSHG